MNLWQVAKQVQYLLQQQTWVDGSTKLFAAESVLAVASDSDIDALDANLVLPMALIVPGGGQSDPQGQDEPGYWVRDITIALAARNSNDRTGQAAVMGGARVGVSDSRGRGVLEMEERVLEAIELLNELEGVTIALKSQSASMTRTDPSDRVYAIKEYTFEVSCTSALFYPAPRRLTATAAAGQVTLAWEVPPARFDRYRMVLRRATGSTPPGSITAGTGVTLSGNMAASVINTGLGAGTYSYSLFCTYDDFAMTSNAAAPASDLRSSDAVSSSGLVVT